MSRIELRLVATHPDRVGGLSFLSQTAYAFDVLAVAHGAMLAGALAGRIFYLGAALPQFKAENPAAPKRYKSPYKPTTPGAPHECKISCFHDLGSKDDQMSGEDAVLCGFDQLDPQYPFCRNREW